MRRRCRTLLILVLVLTVGLSGCALPASRLGPAPYQQTAVIELPALVSVGSVFFVIDLLILPFQAIFGSGNFFPLIGTLVQVLKRFFGDDEPAPGSKAQPPPTPAQLPPDATRPR